MLFLKHAFEGSLNELAQLSWWMGLLTFSTPYSISAILIPTAVLLRFSHDILLLLSKFPHIIVFLYAMIFSLVVQGITSVLENSSEVPHLLDILFVGGIGGFRVCALFMYGTIGIVIGTLWMRNGEYSTKIGTKICVIFIGSYVLLRILRINFPFWWVEITYQAILGPSRFLVLLLVAMGIDKSGFLSFPGDFLSCIGRYSLFSFLMHRICLQVMDKSLRMSKIRLIPEFHYLILLLLTMTCIQRLCRIRDRNQAYNLFLKRFYL
jgi:hypothetical protein